MEIGTIIGFQIVLTVLLFGYCHRNTIIQNLALRQQLTIYLRTVKKTKIKHSIKHRDRVFWFWLSKIWPKWKEHLFIVQPQTVIKWHKKGFKYFWRWKSRAKKKVGRPPITKEHIEFIRRISKDNPSWGEQKIADELELKFGIKHSPSTIRKYKFKHSNPNPGQTWQTFIKNHASDSRYSRSIPRVDRATTSKRQSSRATDSRWIASRLPVGCLKHSE